MNKIGIHNTYRRLNSVAKLLLGIFCFCQPVFAQQYIDPALSASFAKSLNPSLSAVLSPGEGEASLLYRYQWVGMEGAPKSLWFNTNMALGKQGIILGINAKQMKIGVERGTEVSANFTKSLRISEEEYVGLGFNLGYTQQQGDYSSLDPTDPKFGNQNYGTLMYGLSAALIRPDRYYVGVAMPRAIFGSNDGNYVRNFGRDNTFYVSGAMLIDVDESIYIRPSFLTSYREVTGLQIDGSAMIFFTPKFGLGAGYRQRGDFMGQVEFNLGKLRFGYSYNQNLKNKELNRYISNSTHELGLSFQWGSTAKRRLL